jgi:hypothetical protein
MLQAARFQVRDPMTSMTFSIYLILSVALGPGVNSSLQGKRVPEAEKLCFWGVKPGRYVGLTT